jgi:hypothetical protein
MRRLTRLQAELDAATAAAGAAVELQAGSETSRLQAESMPAATAVVLRPPEAASEPAGAGGGRSPAARRKPNSTTTHTQRSRGLERLAPRPAEAELKSAPRPTPAPGRLESSRATAPHGRSQVYAGGSRKRAGRNHTGGAAAIAHAASTRC